MPESKKMRGGVKQRGATWTYYLKVPSIHPLTGARVHRQVTKGGFKTRAEAVRARTEAQAAMHAGTYVERSRMTLREWLADWLPVHSMQVRPATAENYAIIVRLHVLAHPIADVRLQDLRTNQLAQHWQHVHAAGGRGGRRLSARTVKLAHTVVRQALAAAVADQLIARNPSDGVRLPRDQRPADDDLAAWSGAELRAFLATHDDHRLVGLWTLMAFTGMRRGEALALRWDDVDLETGAVRVRRSVAWVDNAPSYDAPKNGESRTVTAPATAREALRSWRRTQVEERLRAGELYIGSGDLVFTMEDGRPIAPQYATNTFKRLVQATPVTAIRLHGLRHTAATLLLRDGISVHLVAKMLGHRDVSVTLNTYAHAIPGDDTALADALERIVQTAG